MKLFLAHSRIYATFPEKSKRQAERTCLPVPPEDLLDMWRQKRNYLDKVAEQNRKKGNEISGVNRVNYDLAILLSKYDSYLKWKEQQKIAIAELDESKKRSIEKIEYTDVARPKRVSSTDNKVDINSMLDEI